MSDFLIKLGKNSTARGIIKKIGIPLTMPQELRRAKGPWEERPLENMSIVVAHIGNALLSNVLADSLIEAGANIWVKGEKEQFQIFHEVGEACGRLPKLINEENSKNLKPDALVFDAMDIKTPEDLHLAYEFFHHMIRKLNICGRCLILAPSVSQASNPIAAASARALEGFIRSMGREIGRNGSTAQIIYVDKGAEERLDPILRFFLSPRSAYISGQAIHVTAKISVDNAFPSTRLLDGKVALVTGAARGIGAATAKTLSLEGAHVICMDRPAENEAAGKLVDEIRGSLLLCDITDKEASNTIIKAIQDQFKGIDIIIHNAGITRDKTLAKMDADRWNQTLDVNLNSLIRVNESLIPFIRKNGRIVCLSSVSGIAGNIGQTNYSASKAGIIGYIEMLSELLLDEKIAVNAVAPGFIETQMTAKIPFLTREAARRLCNLSQGGLPEDIAQTVTFLSSPGAAGITGEVIRICGGSFIGA
ncbi:short chain dehydrogenase family protein [Candidatus Magnetomorum sp. HK-1]|nr:short chain dehydrogenase family protein [Candidatus Magnetomorum sp. HK-1]